MRVTFFLLTLNLLLILHVTSAFDDNRQKRSPAGYDHYFDKFIADKYSDLPNGAGQSYSNYHSHEESGGEESGSEESDGAHDEYNQAEDSGESSSYEENESHEEHHRRRRSPDSYDDHYFFGNKYSDLTNGGGQSYSNYHSHEENGSEESDGAHDEYNKAEDSGESSSYEENESHEEHYRRRRSPASYDDHYNKFIAEHFSDAADFLDAEKEELNNESSETSGSAEEDDDDETDGKAKVKDHSFAYRNNNDYERIKELSEKQVEHLHKKPGNCKHFDKDGMVCSVCKDPETGDTSESCNYASEPKDNKWAYLNRKSSNFKHPKPVEASEQESDESDDDEAEEDEDKATSEQLKNPKSADHKSEQEDASDYGAYRLAGYNKDIDYDEPKFAHYKTFASKYKPKSEKLIELLPSSKTGGNQFKSKNLNQALTDFGKKDWSKCKKVFKGELTCYYCKDASGSSNEECMYVSASNPKSIKVERHDAGSHDLNSRKPAQLKKPTTHVKSFGYSLPLKVAPTKPATFSSTISHSVPFKSAAPTKPTILSTTLGHSLPLKSFSPTKPATFSTTISHNLPLQATSPGQEKFARLRMGRPLMPTKLPKLETAEPLVTPKTSIQSFFGDDLINPSANSKKTIKRTIIKKKKKVTTDDYVPAESRAMHFESHVNHEKQ